ncbi:hypothetical protein BH24ACI4_BH24ACI4_34380 [soil metagenome]
MTIPATRREDGQQDSAPRPLPPVLRRDLGLLDAVGIGFGANVGAGIFVVTGVAAGIAGPAFLVGLAIAAVAVAATANALSSAQLAASYPQAGGAYEYGYRVLPLAGFAAGWKLRRAGDIARTRDRRYGDSCADRRLRSPGAGSSTPRAWRSYRKTAVAEPREAALLHSTILRKRFSGSETG